MKLRFFFDYGGDCLWADDSEARAAYGYPVNLDELPLSVETKELSRTVGALFDELLESKQDEAHSRRQDVYRQRSKELYERLVTELGPSFNVVNEI